MNDQRPVGLRAFKPPGFPALKLITVTDMSEDFRSIGKFGKVKKLGLSTMNEFSSRHYDNEDVNRIIRRALKFKNEDTISHQELLDTAMDIGLDPQILETELNRKSGPHKANFMVCNQQRLMSACRPVAF